MVILYLMFFLVKLIIYIFYLAKKKKNEKGYKFNWREQTDTHNYKFIYSKKKLKNL
ncbi:PIR protein, fragment [Plasmodium yoelii]|uniref:YIR protein n=1 Tax=Plasmodium yoelii TaxID=5861 RepID=A0A4V0KKA0_PLAYE|nr:PIR protein, fragment [Plasmodium yoelii]VTZ77798.1 PIR protein, fragment [Plasmodium yoelii]